MTVRVVLADDQSLLRKGFRMILEAEVDMEIVGEAADGADALRLAELYQPDVILMDVRMPVLDGIAATRAIAESDRASHTRVLILTTFDLDEYAFGALRAGASGFLLKDVPPSELATAIRTVARGDAVVSPRVTRRLLEEYAHTLPDPAAGDPQAEDPALASVTDRDARCSCAWPRACPTPRSPNASTSRKPPSSPTWATCWPSSASATGSRPWSSPSRRAWSGPPRPRPERRAGSGGRRPRQLLAGQRGQLP